MFRIRASLHDASADTQTARNLRALAEGDTRSIASRKTRLAYEHGHSGLGASWR